MVEEICTTAQSCITSVQPGQTLLDLGFVVRTGVDVPDAAARVIAAEGGTVRALVVTGADGVEYGVGANFGAAPARVELLGESVMIAPSAVVVTAPGGIL
ncbi:MAG: hypothetical protein R2854_14210 [Caldilineaceae bacterium]